MHRAKQRSLQPLLELWYFVLPFLAFIGIGLRDPDLVMPMAIFGWLPVVMYWLFNYTKNISMHRTWWQGVLKCSSIAALLLLELFVLRQSFWSVFSLLMFFEAITLSFAIVFYLFGMLRDAWRDEMTFPVVFTIVVLGGSAYGVGSVILQTEQAIFSSTPAMLVFCSAFAFDLFSEFRFFHGIVTYKVQPDESHFDDHGHWYAMAILAWIVLTPLLIEGLRWLGA